ncbi:hypothetical protein FRB90_011425 [Tulasnella sp. 427]|nr:hypothetical protein FRB90_011425 [Tulasnella sp. 427]
MKPATAETVNSVARILLENIYEENILEIESARLNIAVYDSGFPPSNGTGLTSERLSHLNDYVKAITLTIDRVRDRLLGTVATLNTERNSLVPLHRLPLELLVDILRQMIPPASDYYQSGPTGHTYHRRLATLRAICRQWRTIIDDTPAFWPVLDVSDPPRIVSRAVGFSAAYSLEVNLARPSWDLTPRARDSSWRERFLQDAVQHAARWRSAQLTLPNAESLLSISQASAPRLIALDLRLYQLEKLDQEDPENIFRCRNGQLRRLGLSSIAIPWNSSLLCNLESLLISDLDDFAPTLTQILTMLRACPKMVDLELDIPESEADDLPKDEPLLLLLFLKSASLSLSDECASPLLKLLLAPSIDTFELNSNFVFGLDLLPTVLRCLGRLVSFDDTLSLMTLTIKEDTVGWCIQPMTQTPGQSRQVGLVADVTDNEDTLKHAHRFGADYYEAHIESVNAAALDISPVLEELRPVENVVAVHFRNCDTQDLYSFMLSRTDPRDCGFPDVKKLVFQNCRIWPKRLLEIVQDRDEDDLQFEDVLISDPLDQDADAFQEIEDLMPWKGFKLQFKAVDSVARILLQDIHEQNLAEIEAASDETNPLSARLLYLDNYVKAINSTVDRVRDRLWSEVSILNKERNTLVPLHRLPIELLVDILQRATQMDSNKAWMSYSTYHRSLAKHRTICKQWRTVIDNSPSLWATLDVRDPPQIVSMAIARSASYPLDINLGSSSWHEEPQGLGGTWRSSFLRDAVRHAGRWYSARLGFHRVQDLLSISHTPAPRLRSLNLVFIKSVKVDLERTGTIFQCQEGQLQSLALYGVAIPWNSKLLCHLELLSIRNLANFAPTRRQILGTLRQCPQLVNLTLEAVEAEAVSLPNGEPPVQLPYLSSATLQLNPEYAASLLETSPDAVHQIPLTLLRARSRRGVTSNDLSTLGRIFRSK